MLTITEPASAHLRKLLDDANAPDEAAVRFIMGQQGLSLKMDNQQPGDQIFEHNGRTVLLLDDQLSNLLADRTLDVKETERGTMLALT